MNKSPIVTAVEKIQKDISAKMADLGGLHDNHIKFITYYLIDVIKIENFTFEIKYLEKPKRFVIRTFTKNGQEVYCKPKPADFLDKMRDHMGLDQWVIEFNKRENNEKTD